MTRFLALTGAYVGAILLSVVYLLTFKFWDIEIPSLHGLGHAIGAVGSAAIFWALAGAFIYYFLRLDRSGRQVFAGLAGVLLVLLILFWPGLYDVDSISGLHEGRGVPYNGWLGTAPIVERAVLRHLPWLGAVTGVQLLFFTLATAYGCQVLRQVTKGLWAPALLIALSLLSAPLMYGLMLVSRETWLSIVTLFLAIECVVFFADEDWRDGRCVGRMLALGAAAAFFRPEAILYVAAVALVAFGRLLSSPGGLKTSRGAVLRALAPFVVISFATRVLVPIGIPAIQHPGAYDMSLWIEPVGTILSGDQSHLDPADVATIYTVVPERLVHENWGVGKEYNDKLWGPLNAGKLHPPETKAEQARVREAVGRIVAAEPGIFFSNRLQGYKRLDHPTTDEIAVQPTQTFIDSPRPRTAIAKLGEGVRYETVWPQARRGIETIFASTLQNPIGLFQWAVTPDLVFLALAIAMFRMAPGFAFAAFVVAVRAPALFVLMPGSQSKYYTPQEFALPFILAGVVVIAVQALSSRRQGLQPA